MEAEEPPDLTARGLSFDGGKVLSMLSLELLILSEYDRADVYTRSTGRNSRWY